MNKNLLVLKSIIYLLLLTACQPSEAGIQEAVDRTLSAQLTTTSGSMTTIEPSPTLEPTSTLVPLASLDLSEIIFLPYELPAGFAPSQMRSGYASFFGDYPVDPINKIWHDLEYKGEKGGSVLIYIYETKDEVIDVYNSFHSQIIGDLPEDGFSDIGEKSFGVNSYFINYCFIVFIRCNSLVSISLEESDAYSGMLDYARKLDARLTESVCRE